MNIKIYIACGLMLSVVSLQECYAYTFTVKDGETCWLTGGASNNASTYSIEEKARVTLRQGTSAMLTYTRVVIKEGATVTLNGVNLSHAETMICQGNAAIVLADGSENRLTTSAANAYNAALIAGPSGTTLTIRGETQGSGRLVVTGGSCAAGIGACGENSSTRHVCGNITIEGGLIEATGGEGGAGIGTSKWGSSAGNIVIVGGQVFATGGKDAAGIGSGYGSYNSCGSLTISNSITKIVATKGSSSAANCIGKGGSTSSCGSVAISAALNQTYSNNGLTLTVEPITYTVTWKNEDGSILLTQNKVLHGTIPTYNGGLPTKEPTAAHTYAFVGWNPELAGITSNVTYTALYAEQTAANYEEWAVDRGFGGPDEVSEGVANIFRYVFGCMDGALATPMLSIKMDGRNQTISVPTIVNSAGVTLKIISTDNITIWELPHAEERVINVGEEGNILYNHSDRTRFYRLKVE